MKKIKSILKYLLLRLMVSPVLKMFVFFERMFGEVLLKKIKNKGGNCVFEGFGRLHEVDNIKMGEHIFIGRNFFIRAAGGV